MFFRRLFFQKNNNKSKKHGFVKESIISWEILNQHFVVCVCFKIDPKYSGTYLVNPQAPFQKGVRGNGWKCTNVFRRDIWRCCLIALVSVCVVIVVAAAVGLGFCFLLCGRQQRQRKSGLKLLVADILSFPQLFPQKVLGCTLLPSVWSNVRSFSRDPSQGCVVRRIPRDWLPAPSAWPRASFNPSQSSESSKGTSFL